MPYILDLLIISTVSATLPCKSGVRVNIRDFWF